MSHQVRLRVAAAVILAPAVVGVSTALSIHRDQAELPASVSAVRAALVEAAALGSCLQGTQDDMFSAGGGAPTPILRSSAAARLRTCDDVAFGRTVNALKVPPAAPLQSQTTARTRAALAHDVQLLRQAAADARTARRASLSTDDSRGSQLLVVAYRSFTDAIGQADGWLTVAEAAQSSLASEDQRGVAVDQR